MTEDLELAGAVEASGVGVGVGVGAVVGAAGHEFVVVGADAIGCLFA